MAVDLEVLVDEEQERVLLGRSHAGGMETSCWDPVEQSDMMNLLLTAHLISAIHSGTTHALIGCSAWDDAPPRVHPGRWSLTGLQKHLVLRGLHWL